MIIFFVRKNSCKWFEKRKCKNHFLANTTTSLQGNGNWKAIILGIIWNASSPHLKLPWKAMQSDHCMGCKIFTFRTNKLHNTRHCSLFKINFAINWYTAKSTEVLLWTQRRTELYSNEYHKFISIPINRTRTSYHHFTSCNLF